MKKIFYTIIIVGMYTIHFCVPVFALSPGSTSANFLKIAVGARSTGMGETAVGLCDDVSSIYWNPAGIGTLSNAETSFLYTKWLTDMSYQYFLAALPIKSGSFSGNTLGLAAYNLSYGDIQGADYQGLKTGNVKAGDMAFALADGFSIADNLYAGISAKYIDETLDTVKANAFAGDAGIFYKKDLLNGKMGFGLSVRNIGSEIEFVSEKFPLPTDVAFGTSYKRNIFGLEDPLTVAVDVNMPNDNKVYYDTGFEYWVVNLIALRAGYKTGQDIGSGFRFGAGLKMNIFQFDFAYAGYDKLGDTYYLGMTLKFGTPTKLRLTTMPLSTEETEALLKSAEKLFNDGRYAEAILEYNKILKLDSTNQAAIEGMRKSNEKLQQK